MSFPSVPKGTYFPDTSAYKNKFFQLCPKAEKMWADDQCEQSNRVLKEAINIGKYICQNQRAEPVRIAILQKLNMFVERYQEREKQLDARRQNKNVQKPKQMDKDKQKMIEAISEAIVCQKPNVSWDDVGGLEVAKTTLKEAVCLPMSCPQIFFGLLEPWRGILLYGPPGTGKTFLAKACASQSKGTFFSVSASDLKSKYVGESEKLIKTLFTLGKEKKPSIIFIDEVDSLCSNKSQGEQNQVSNGIRTQFLSQMDGLSSNPYGILTLGTTNFPWDIQQAILRRFERRVYIPLPEKSTRAQIIKIKVAKNPNTLSEIDIQYLAEATQGFSGADLYVLLKAGIYQTVRNMQNAQRFKKLPTGKLIAAQQHENGDDIILGNWLNVESGNIQLAPLTLHDMLKALKNTKPAFDLSKIKKYEEWTEKFGTKS